jgi:hypothetical protein
MDTLPVCAILVGNKFDWFHFVREPITGNIFAPPRYGAAALTLANHMQIQRILDFGSTNPMQL